jgi:hypothetical protein
MPPRKIPSRHRNRASGKIDSAAAQCHPRCRQSVHFNSMAEGQNTNRAAGFEVSLFAEDLDNPE